MDLYAVLGIEPDASPAEIKRAYRRLARRYHPDINPGDPAAEMRYRQITDAYETLIDDERRRRYDESGVIVNATVQGSVGFEGFDFTIEAVEGPRASTFGDLFATVIRQGFERPGERPERGADLHGQIEAPFEEAVRGAERHIAVTRLVPCTACAGAGFVQTSNALCSNCEGSGTVKSTRGHMVFTRPCEQCGGTGRQPKSRCGRCGGNGLEARTEAVSFTIPAGTSDGTSLRIEGKGNYGRCGGPAGDLYVAVHVLAHAVFRREGNDLFLRVPVSVHEAGLGARVDIPTLEGAARLRVPPGTQSGQRFRLRERGVPSPRDGRRGDLIVEVQIVLPRILDERSKELLREFAKINSEDVRADWLQGKTNA